MLSKSLRACGITRFLVLACAAVASAGMASKSQAALIVTTPAAQAAAANTGSYRSDLGGGSQAADSFIVASAETIFSVHWWGNYDAATPATPSFSIRFFLDNGSGSPLAAPFSTQAITSVLVTPTGFTTSASSFPPSRPVLDFQANLISPVALTAGTKYYMSIVDTTTAQWNWSYPAGGGSWQRTGEGLNWSSQGVNMAFELHNTLVPGTTSPNAAVVPLPSAAGSGAALLALVAAMSLTARYIRKTREQV